MQNSPAEKQASFPRSAAHREAASGCPGGREAQSQEEEREVARTCHPCLDVSTGVYTRDKHSVDFQELMPGTLAVGGYGQLPLVRVELSRI